MILDTGFLGKDLVIFYPYIGNLPGPNPFSVGCKTPPYVFNVFRRVAFYMPPDLKDLSETARGC